MKKTYNLSYKEGKYYIEYSMPENEEGKLIIDEKKMELDSVQLYKMFFEKTAESIEIILVNKIDENVDERVLKKGRRMCETIQSLCKDICEEINKKCFAEWEFEVSDLMVYYIYWCFIELHKLEFGRRKIRLQDARRLGDSDNEQKIFKIYPKNTARRLRW